MSSAGPGNLHLISGPLDAQRSGAPVVAIASHIPSRQIGTGFFQETHRDRLFGECSVDSELVSTAEQAPRVMHGAVQHARGLAGIEGADLLLLLGTDFPYDQFLPEGVRTAQVDRAAQHLGRRTDVDPAVHADVLPTRTALEALVDPRADHRLPVTVMVFNNSSLGTVKLGMLVDGMPDFGVDAPATAYAEIVRAMGFRAVRVTDPTEIAEAYRAALAHPGPALVELVTDPNGLSMPPKVTGEQFLGFATAMTKVVLNGGAGEAVSMARSNIRNLPRS